MLLCTRSPCKRSGSQWPTRTSTDTQRCARRSEIEILSSILARHVRDSKPLENPFFGESRAPHANCARLHIESAHTASTPVMRVFSRARASGACRASGSRRGVAARAVATQNHLGLCPPHAEETVQAIREAVAHSTCAPYEAIAGDDTLIINPPWADEPRTTVRVPLLLFKCRPKVCDVVIAVCVMLNLPAKAAPARTSGT